MLTGSTNYLADRGLSETLAGRAGRLLLWPLSMGERLGVRETFLDLLVTEGLTGRQRRNWFEAYVHDVVSREALRPIAEVRLETGDAEAGRETASNYVTLLEALHLVTLLPA